MNNLPDAYKRLQVLFPTSDKEVKVLNAAVAVVWRKAPTLEVYLVQRAHTMRFLPGYWSFPGGKQELEEEPAATARRELQEETGLWVELASMQGLGRWVTPPAAMRFDTQFFLVECPPEQQPDFQLSEGELVGGRWIAPIDALREFESGDLLINAPILGIVEALVSGVEGACARGIAAAQRVETKWPRLRPVAGGISVLALTTPTLPPATRTNCYVVGSEEMIVIDPATPYPEEREALRAALDKRIAEGGRIVEIWLTHDHGDHVGAAEYLSELYQVPICAHRESARQLAGICRIDRFLEEGETRALAGPLPRKLQCVFTPGHARGHLCFLETHTQALIAGDMVAATGTILIAPEDGDMALYFQSLQRLLALGAQLLLPAHGCALSNPSEVLQRYIDHRNMRESKVLSALSEEAQDLSALVKVVYHDTPTNLHPLAERSLLSHLIKLGKESLAGKDRLGWRLRSS